MSLPSVGEALPEVSIDISAKLIVAGAIASRDFQDVHHDKDAAQALKVLQQLGLIGRDEQGRLRQTEPVVETHEGPLGHQVVQFHREMLRCASEAIDRVPREEREIAALTLCVSEERMEELRAEVEAFRRDLFRRYQTDPRPERVVQANFQVFPLSKKGSDQ